VRDKKNIIWNMRFLPDLIREMSEAGGYWCMDCSESDNISIRYCPFVGKNGKYCEDVFIKRCYDLRDFVSEIIEEIKHSPEVKNFISLREKMDEI
jgi:hypothetical protein